MSEVATINNIDQIIKNSDKQRLLPSKQINNIKHRDLDSTYFILLKDLYDENHINLKLVSSNFQIIQEYNVLVRLHLISIKKNQSCVYYSMTKLGKYVMDDLIKKINKNNHKREALDFLIALFVFLLCAGISLININFAMSLGAPIFFIADVKLMWSIFFKSPSNLPEKDVLPCLKKYLDKHDYIISKSVFREHEEDDA